MNQPAAKTTIHAQMTIEEILSLFPHKAQKLSYEITNAGLHCIGCHAAVWETLEAGMKSHGMGEEAIQRLVDRLNALLEENDACEAASADETITLTPRAAKKFLSILEDEGKIGWGMRFAERLAGCSGFEYVLDYSQKPEPDDVVIHSNGVDIHVCEKMLPTLGGSDIDYLDGLQGSGFKITNRKVKSACGCGSSHGYS